MRLAGKVALITGVAAAIEGELMGFGGQATHIFLHEGAKVVLSDIRDDLGQRAVKILREAGKDARYIHLDVTQEDEWEVAISFVVAEFGKLNVLLNNAGAGHPMKVEDMPEETWDRGLDIHAKGVFLGTKHAIPAMRAAGGGSIVNTSSVMGIVGSPTTPAYSAAKGAIRIFTKSVAIQYAAEGIRINSIHPGYADTPLTDGRFHDPEFRAELLRKTPIGRLGNAEDIANGMLSLASDESSCVTGLELVIDGSMTAI